MKRQDGIRTLADLRARCRIEPECKCWRWGYAVKSYGTASVTLRVDGKKRDLTGRRAALILAGRRPPIGAEALPTDDCLFLDCVNPAHARWGTRRERQEILAARGLWKTPSGTRALREHALAMRKLSDLQRAEVACSTGPAQKVAEQYGVSDRLVYHLRSGIKGRTPAASVFDWRP